MSMNQADFLVIEHFIVPLRVLFGGLEEKQEAVYCKHLRDFSQSTLTKAAESLEKNHRYKRFPLLAECLDACRNAADSTSRTSTGEWRPKKINPGTDAQAADVLQSALGQTALREGWGNSLRLCVLRTGKTEFNATDIQGFRESHAKAVQAAKMADIKKDSDRMAASLWGIWEDMQRYENELVGTYLRRAVV